MILLRIAEAIRRQDWFVFVIEVMVVVVGIFIGLRVDDWNQNRIDRVDEQIFLERIHIDIQRADELTRVLRNRRMGRLEHAYSAADVLFQRVDRSVLTKLECDAIASLQYLSMAVVDLPSLMELSRTGRIHIIRDDDLRSALVSLAQYRETLIVNAGGVDSTTLASSYPDLITLESIFDSELGEAQSVARCNTAAMIKNRSFLNDFTIGVEVYDAYIRDGLRPWSQEFQRAHKLIDAVLRIDPETH